MMDFPERTTDILHLPEPLLEFGHDQVSEHPKDGLFLYGPHEALGSVRHVSVGVVGTEQGLGFVRQWATKLSGLVRVPPPTKKEKKNRIHLSDFPGLAETFNISINPDEFVCRTISAKAIDDATRTRNHHEAVAKAVDLYLSEIIHHDRNEEHKVDIWLLVLPEIIFERCKPQSRRSGVALIKGAFGKRQKARSDLPLLQDVIDQSEEAIFDDIPDFHRQAKAQLLGIGYTSQLIRETTLAPGKNIAGYPTRASGTGDRRLEPGNGAVLQDATQAPWRLARVRPSVCYLGLVFKTLPNHPQNYACCAAQMFLTEGDGVVFRGANGPWKTGEREFHLKPAEAKNLISMVLETFEQKHHAP